MWRLLESLPTQDHRPVSLSVHVTNRWQVEYGNLNTFALKSLKTSISLSSEMKISSECEEKIGFCDQINFGNPGLKIRIKKSFN